MAHAGRHPCPQSAIIAGGIDLLSRGKLRFGRGNGESLNAGGQSGTKRDRLADAANVVRVYWCRWGLSSKEERIGQYHRLFALLAVHNADPVDQQHVLPRWPSARERLRDVGHDVGQSRGANGAASPPASQGSYLSLHEAPREHLRLPSESLVVGEVLESHSERHTVIRWQVQPIGMGRFNGVWRQRPTGGRELQHGSSCSRHFTCLRGCRSSRARRSSTHCRAPEIQLVLLDPVMQRLLAAP